MPPSQSYKLPKSAERIIMPLVLSVFMTCIVSAISTIRAMGLNDEALHMWPSAWMLSWLVAFPTMLIILPLVRRIVGAVVHS